MNPQVLAFLVCAAECVNTIENVKKDERLMTSVGQRLVCLHICRAGGGGGGASIIMKHVLQQFKARSFFHVDNTNPGQDRYSRATMFSL
jgi:hypothetical protein